VLGESVRRNEFSLDGLAVAVVPARMVKKASEPSWVTAWHWLFAMHAALASSRVLYWVESPPARPPKNMFA